MFYLKCLDVLMQMPRRFFYKEKVEQENKNFSKSLIFLLKFSSMTKRCRYVLFVNGSSLLLHRNFTVNV